MATELQRLPLATGEDILTAHEWAQRLAQLAGANAIERLWFATRVTEICEPGETITFSISKINYSYLLRANSSNYTSGIELEVPKNIDKPDLIDIHETFSKNRAELEQGYKTMRQYSFALSHELKNSLAKLKLGVSLVEMEEMSAAVKDYVQIIHRATARLEHTMKSLDQIIKLGHYMPEIIRKVSPETLFEDVKEEFDEALDRMNATVSVGFSDVTEINYIETYLRSIFSNMLSNAIKYADPGRNLHFSIMAYKTDDGVVIRFTDNGQGIDLDTYGDKLFMPFTRFSENTEGTGIGLYLVRNMVGVNGGTVEVESKPGKGTTFAFFLREYQ
jgi:signal transduction histidine kinase